MPNHKQEVIYNIVAFIVFMILLPLLVIKCQEQQYKDWKYEYEQLEINNR